MTRCCFPVVFAPCFSVWLSVCCPFSSFVCRAPLLLARASCVPRSFSAGVGRVCHWPRLPPAVVVRSSCAFPLVVRALCAVRCLAAGGWTRVPLATPSSRCPRAPSFCCAHALRPKVSASGGLDACALGHALPPLSLLRALRVPACLGLFQRGVGCVCRWPRLPPAVVAARRFCCALALRSKVLASGGLDACASGHALPPLSSRARLASSFVPCVLRSLSAGGWTRVPVATPSSRCRLFLVRSGRLCFCAWCGCLVLPCSPLSFLLVFRARVNPVVCGPQRSDGIGSANCNHTLQYFHCILQLSLTPAWNSLLKPKHLFHSLACFCCNLMIWTSESAGGPRPLG